MTRLFALAFAASFALLAVAPAASAAELCTLAPRLPPGGNVPDTYNDVRDGAAAQCDSVREGAVDALESALDAVVLVCNDQLGDTLCPL